VLASCSFDRSVNVWEEVEDVNGTKAWNRCATLVDARDSVQDIEFAPPHAGLKLATASMDGNVRVYEASDVTNMSQWPLSDDFESEKGGVLSLAWNPHPFERAMLAVASHNKEAPVKLWEYNEALRRWVHAASIAGHTESVHDIAWAPFLGRSYHIIATASKDQTVRLWSLTRDEESGQKDQQMAAQFKGGKQQQTVPATELRIKEEASFDDHAAEVRRVSWNVTGTVLASSGDDGNVRLFRRSFASGKWEVLQTMSGSGEEQS
jgi:nucleoporin SEH1